MINENRIGIEQNPWPVVVPVLLVATLTIGASLFADAVSRVSLGIDVMTVATTVALQPGSPPPPGLLPDVAPLAVSEPRE